MARSREGLINDSPRDCVATIIFLTYGLSELLAQIHRVLSKGECIMILKPAFLQMYETECYQDANIKSK